MKKPRKKRKKPTGPTSVYMIKVKGVTRYYGITNNIDRRWKQHLASIRATQKDLTKYKQTFHFRCVMDSFDLDIEEDIEFFILDVFKSRVDARRFEALNILSDYFGDNECWQKIPNISDR